MMARITAVVALVVSIVALLVVIFANRTMRAEIQMLSGIAQEAYRSLDACRAEVRMLRQAQR
jgi:hypothetical protein